MQLPVLCCLLNLVCGGQEEPTIKAIADKHGKTTGQVMLQWGIRRGISVIPRAGNPEHLKVNAYLCFYAVMHIASQCYSQGPLFLKPSSDNSQCAPVLRSELRASSLDNPKRSCGSCLALVCR